MARHVVVLSGRICSGKTQLAQGLHDRFGFVLVKTHELIRGARPEVPKERRALQEAGTALDTKTSGQWVADALERRLAAEVESQDVVVDSTRIKPQIDALRGFYGFQVVHIHLTAPTEVLRQRYEARKGSVAELATYEDAAADLTEQEVESLAQPADVLIDTSRNTPQDVLTRVVARLGLCSEARSRLVDIIVGGQYGSEGKGHIVSFIAPEYDVLIRVGGPNAGHSVFGEPTQVFKHLPSGTTRAPDALLVLGPGAVLWLPELLDEIAEFSVDVDRLAIDPQAMLINEADRAREAELRKQIASTAQGVGQALSRKVRRDGEAAVRLARDEPKLAPYRRPTAEILEEAYANGRRIMLEGTQGSGLSLHHGCYPYVTSRDTNASGCLAEAGIPPGRVRRVLMVCRTYPIRVGGPSGPMDQPIEWSVIAGRSGILENELKKKELTTRTKTLRRPSEFSWTQLRKAALINAPTDIALTFADYLSVKNQGARRFEQLNPETVMFIEEVERVAQAPVSLIATRFDWRGVIDRRRW